MSKLPLDLSKFRKVKSDQHSSTLQHPDGHEIKISHKMLSPAMKSGLDKIPMTGPKLMADGGDVEEDTPEKIASDASENEPTKDESHKDERSFADKAANVMWGGGKPPPQQDLSPAVQNTPSPSQQNSPELNAANGPATVNAPINQDPFGLQASQQQQLQGMQTAGAGQQAEAQAVGQQGAQNLEQEQNYQTQAQKNLQDYNTANAPILKARQDLMTDIANSHIDPKRYLSSLSTGSKIQNGIGLILGGMGAGLTHGPNLAYNYLQSQIQNDLDAQKNDLGKKETLLSHNFQQTGDLREAYNMTKLQNNDILASHLRMTADQTSDPIAKARAMQIYGMTMQNSAQLQHQMAITKMQQNAFGGQGGTNNSMALESMTPEMRERAVQLPGGGMKLAITKDGAKEVRQQIQTMQPINDSLDELERLGPSALIPGSPENQKAKSIQAQLIPLVNENAGLKRLSSEDINNIKNMLKDPTSFSGQIAGGARTREFKAFLNNKLLNSMGNQLEGGMAPSKAVASGTFGFKPRKS